MKLFLKYEGDKEKLKLWLHLMYINLFPNYTDIKQCCKIYLYFYSNEQYIVLASADLFSYLKY